MNAQPPLAFNNRRGGLNSLARFGETGEMKSVSEQLSRIKGLLQQGMVAPAKELCRELLQFAASDASVWFYSGTASLLAQDIEESVSRFRQAIVLEPRHASAWHNLSVALRTRGELAEAEICSRQALTINATNSDYWAGLAESLCLLEREPEAEACFRQAISIDRQNSDHWTGLARVLRIQQKLIEAESCSRQAISLDASKVDNWTGLAGALIAQGRYREASEAYRQALSYDPSSAKAWWFLGIAEQTLDRHEAAREAFERCLSIDPNHKDARLYLAGVLRAQWRLSRAEHEVERVVADHPNCDSAWALLGHIRLGQGKQEEAASALQRSVTLHPDAVNHSGLLVSLQYQDDVTPDGLLCAHRQWYDLYARHIAPAPFSNTRRRSSDFRLKLGIVLADTGLNPFRFLALPALEALDKTKCSIVAYSDPVAEGEHLTRFKEIADLWRTTIEWPTEKVADQIREDEIDVLVDLSGHTGNRLLVFAHRPAPVQMTWLGYVGTTGLETMDFLLADRYHVRPGEEAYYVEKVLRLPDGYACYGPPDNAPPVGPPPVLAAGHVTFGCFSSPGKFWLSILGAWTEILRRVPTARLLLKYGGLDQPEIQQRLRACFEGRGVEGERVIFEGWSPPHELLVAYRRVDLALDTQPYSGGLTTCEALWMGVPVITFPGTTFAGRHATSHLSNASYPQFVAADLNGYVDLAVEWAHRLDELALIRSRMREQVRSSPLCDAPRFASDFLNVLNQAWQSRY